MKTSIKVTPGLFESIPSTHDASVISVVVEAHFTDNVLIVVTPTLGSNSLFPRPCRYLKLSIEAFIGAVQKFENQDTGVMNRACEAMPHPACIMVKTGHTLSVI